MLSLLAVAVAGADRVRAQEACDGGASQEEQAATQEAQSFVVRMQLDKYDPETITVPVGATITWSNEEEDPRNSHNVIDANGAFESTLTYPGETWSFTFDTPGEYVYYCDLHEGMYGKVIVQ
jgi:plastocyanin